MTNIFVKNIKDKFDQKNAFEIRSNVFCKEQKVSKIIEFDGMDEFCNHYLAKFNEFPIGTARVRKKKGGIYKIERMAVLKEYRMKGAGKALIEEILDQYLTIRKTNNLILNSQIKAKDFYKKFGFVEVGKEFIEANIRHIKMIHKC